MCQMAIFMFIFSESKFYAVCNGETHFQIRGPVAELHAFEHGGTTVGTFVLKICMLKHRVGLKNHVLTMKHGNVGYFNVTD